MNKGIVNFQTVPHFFHSGECRVTPLKKLFFPQRYIEKRLEYAYESLNISGKPVFSATSLNSTGGGSIILWGVMVSKGQESLYIIQESLTKVGYLDIQLVRLLYILGFASDTRLAHDKSTTVTVAKEWLLSNVKRTLPYRIEQL